MAEDRERAATLICPTASGHHRLRQMSGEIMRDDGHQGTERYRWGQAERGHGGDMEGTWRQEVELSIMGAVFPPAESRG